MNSSYSYRLIYLYKRELELEIERLDLYVKLRIGEDWAFLLNECLNNTV